MARLVALRGSKSLSWLLARCLSQLPGGCSVYCSNRLSCVVAAPQEYVEPGCPDFAVAALASEFTIQFYGQKFWFNESSKAADASVHQ